MNRLCEIPRCGKRHQALGLCPMHRWRLDHYGSVDKPPTPTVAQRFWAKVAVTDGCWLWTASLSPSGYGKFKDDSALVGAHRWAYEFCVGAIPKGRDLDHLCRVRRCVRPEHLAPVTRQENLLRGIGPIVTRARARSRTACRRGHPVNDENIYVNPRGIRTCKPCRREAERRWYAKRHTVEIIGEVEE